MFSFTHKWNFPSNNYGQIFGIADSGVETFKGTPIKSLAREICQNSLDNHIHNGQPTRIEFELFEIPPNKIPDFKGLEYALKRGLEFWSLQKSDKAKIFFRTALATSKKSNITCLRISDFNTTGLTGSREEYNSPWCNLTKSTGASDKTGSNGGSFGIGKFAPYACSVFRTVFYSTADNEGICAYQGVSRLTSFKDKKGETTQGIGFYGNDKNSPVYEQFSLNPDYARHESNHGTDIFIVGFTGDEDWKHLMVASILDGFLCAVYSNDLIVDVDGILISKDTLPELMVSHKAYFEEHADEYYETLVHEAARTFEKEQTGDAETTGKLTLHMLIMPKFHRQVAMVRQTGMKIKDKNRINALIPFAGLLYIEGDALNTYLRSLENPKHVEWEIERADNKSKARQLLNSFTKFIKECLDEMKNDDSEEALDPSVGEYLAATQDDEQENLENAESIQDTINNFKIRVANVNPKPTGTQSGNEGNTEVDNEKGEIIVTDLPGEGGSGGEHEGQGGGGGGGHNPGSGNGSAPIEHRKTLSAIAPANVRNLVRNKNTGEYTIIFTPSASASDGYIEVYMSAESQNYDAPLIGASCTECPGLTFANNRISSLSFTEKQPLKVNIQLDYRDYCPLEVKAYGNKI